MEEAAVQQAPFARSPAPVPSPSSSSSSSLPSLSGEGISHTRFQCSPTHSSDILSSRVPLSSEPSGLLPTLIHSFPGQQPPTHQISPSPRESASGQLSASIAPAMQANHPWLKRPINAVIRRESALLGQEPQPLTTFNAAFIQHRWDHDPDFNKDFARCEYFLNPLLESHQLRAIIPQNISTARASFKVYGQDIQVWAGKWQKSIHEFVYKGLHTLIKQEGGYLSW